MLSFNSLEEFKNWANKYNINYEEKYEFNNDIEEGKVISYSHKTGDTIKNDDTIVVTISQGKKTKVPNIIGDTKSEAIKKVENAKLNYNIVYENSNEEKNKVIKQSLASGSVVAENSTITITLSNGKKPTTNSNQSKSSSSKNNNSSSNTNNNSSTSNNTPSCDTSKGSELNIQTGDDGTQTKDMIAQLNPNHKFSFNIVSSCPNGDKTPGTVCNQLEGVWKNYCNTISITIVN